MAQHDYIIANQSGAAFRSDLNNGLPAIVSQNSGAAQPSTTYAYQWWADTTTGLLKIRNAANNAWITLFQLDGEWTTLALENGTAAAPSLYFKDSGTDTGLFSPGANQLAISTGGVQRLLADASGNLTASGGLTVANLNGGPLAGFRNRIINGNFDFWQRGTSTTATGNTYLADRWLSAYSTGGTVSQETSSLPTGSRYAWKFVASASNSFFQMGQQIEYGNCIDFQNTTVTISFMARAVTATAGSTALIFRTRTIAGVDGVCVFTGTNVDSALTLTTSWTRYTVTRTLPATFGSLSLEFVLGSHVSGDGIMLAQVQIEPGTVATPFEQRPIGTELALCQRYFQKNNGTASRALFQGYCVNGQGYPSRTPFHQQMRGAPTVSLTHADALGFPGTAGSTSADASTFVESRIANSTQNSGYFISDWNASAEL